MKKVPAARLYEKKPADHGDRRLGAFTIQMMWIIGGFMKRDKKSSLGMFTAYVICFLALLGLFTPPAAQGALYGCCYNTTQCYCRGYIDNDADGYAVENSGVNTSRDTGAPYGSGAACDTACTDDYCDSQWTTWTVGRVKYTNGSAVDCNDTNSAINPGHAEVCGNGIDDKYPFIFFPT